MTHFLYKPHVRGQKNITTPDLLIDQLLVYQSGGDDSSAKLFSTALLNQRQVVELDQDRTRVLPALVLVSAGGGSILTIANAVTGTDDKPQMINVSRHAQRYHYVNSSMERLTIAVDSVDGATAGVNPAAVRCPPIPESVVDKNAINELPRCTMIVVIPGWEQGLTLDDGEMFEESIRDDNGTVWINHRLVLNGAEGKPGLREKPKARFSIGPTSGNVTEYI